MSPRPGDQRGDAAMSAKPGDNRGGPAMAAVTA